MGAGLTTADIGSRHRDRRGDGDQRPHVAGVRELLHLFKGENLLHARRAHIDHRRVAGDRHGLLERRHGEFDVHRCSKANRDLNIRPLQGFEADEFVGNCVGAGRQGGEAVIAARVGDGGLHTHHRRTLDRDRHAGENTAARIAHPAVDGSSGPGRLRECDSGGQPRDHQQPDHTTENVTRHFFSSSLCRAEA